MNFPTRRILSIFVFICAGLLLISPSAFAQSTGTIQGTVTDTTGASVAGAQITVRSSQTGVERSAVSDSVGNFTFPSLQPGTYSLETKASGFKPVQMNNVVLDVSQTIPVNIRLGVASTSEVIEVQGSAPVIDATTITVGHVIDQRTVQEIPLNGRHFLDLSNLAPGSVVAPQSGNLTSPSRGLGANSFITAGNREDTVNFMINGVNLNDMVQNQIVFQPSINTVSEFKLINSTYSAEYGRSSGSIVQVATRSGGNQFHGEVFDYIRNNDLDARNYFNNSPNPQAALKRNNFGGAIGGPIWKDHTFFFFSYEGLRQAQTITLNSGVLTAAQRATFQTVNANSKWLNMLNLIPSANDPTGSRFIGNANGPVNIDQFTLDVSHNFSPKDTLHGYYAFQKDARTEPNLQGNTLPGFGDHRNSHRQIFTLNEVHVFSPQLVNEARLGLNRISIAFTPNALLNPVDYGISDGIATASGIPQTSIPNVFNIGGPSGFAQGRNDTLGIFSDTLTDSIGRHTVKFGGEYRRFINDNFGGDAGTMVFNSVALFTAATANTFTITPTIVSSRIFTNAIGAFVQDNWKLSNKLTLELGFRFEWNGSPTEGANRFVNFLPGSASLVQINSHGYDTVYNQNYNYEPRVGFSWDPVGEGRTVLRGAYGYLADQPSTNAVTGLASNPPLAVPLSYSSTTAPIPVGNAYNLAKAAGLAPSATLTNFKNGYTQSFNLNLQQQLTTASSFELGYFGSHGIHLRVRRNLNQLINGTTRPFPTTSANSPILPGNALGNIAGADSDSFSHYNALWFTVKQNLSHGLQFNSSYVWSKSQDLNSLGSQGVYVLQDSTNPRNNYGLSDFDVRNRFVFSGLYSLPFHGNRIKDGWQFGGITQLQSGNPLNIVTTSTYTGVSATVRPDLVGPIRIHRVKLASNNIQYVQSFGCYNTVVTGCSFLQKSAGFGNLQRNALSGPGFADVDLSLEKNTQIFENLKLQFRADAFDILNHPNFGQPSATLSLSATTPVSTTGTFGQISNTRFLVGDVGSSRQLQFALKLLF